jgi:hypothetical protein
MMSPGQELHDARQVVAAAATEAGRNPAAIGMEGRVSWTGDAGAVTAELEAWADAGASHVSVNTMGAGLTTVDEHLEVLATVAESLPST